MFKALETAVENGRLVSPIILDAEVLPGPGGHMPQMGVRGALTPPRTRIRHVLARRPSRARGERRARAPAIPPRGRLVATHRRDVGRHGRPRAVRSRRFRPLGGARPGRDIVARAATGACGAREKISPPRKNPAAGLAFPFQSAYAWHQRQRAMMHQRLRGAKVKMFGNATGR